MIAKSHKPKRIVYTWKDPKWKVVQRAVDALHRVPRNPMAHLVLWDEMPFSRLTATVYSASIFLGTTKLTF